MTETKLSDLYSDPSLAQFYNVNQTVRHDYAYCVQWTKNANSILDLGCGTGTLASLFSSRINVVAVDPAKAMLNIAADQIKTQNISWVEGDARNIRLGQRFDCVILSGHAFQVFLTREDQLQVLMTIAAHLNQGGQFIFDSRNPSFPQSKERTKSQTLHKFLHPEHGEMEAWNESTYDTSNHVLTYTNSYHILKTSEVMSAQEKICYPSQTDIADLMIEAGLKIEKWLGGWDGDPYHPKSREIIPIGGLISSKQN